jgi:hypothetical protein
MKGNFKIILTGTMAQLIVTQCALAGAVAYPSPAWWWCSGACLLILGILAFLLIKHLEDMSANHYQITCYPPPPPKCRPQEENFLLRPTFLR